MVVQLTPRDWGEYHKNDNTKKISQTRGPGCLREQRGLCSNGTGIIHGTGAVLQHQESDM